MHGRHPTFVRGVCDDILSSNPGTGTAGGVDNLSAHRGRECESQCGTPVHDLAEECFRRGGQVHGCHPAGHVRAGVIPSSVHSHTVLCSGVFLAAPTETNIILLEHLQQMSPSFFFFFLRSLVTL